MRQSCTIISSLVFRAGCVICVLIFFNLGYLFSNDSEFDQSRSTAVTSTAVASTDTVDNADYSSDYQCKLLPTEKSQKYAPIQELTLVKFEDLQVFANVQTDSTFKPVPNSKEVGNLEEKRFSKDPTHAMLWSIIPGGGQYYNESYLKSGLFFTSATILTSFTVYNYSKFFPLQDQYDANVSTLNSLADDSPLRLDIEQDNVILLNRKENYRDSAHLSIFLLGVSYFVATMDAYVGAHLYDFNVDDDLEATLLPNPLGGGMIYVTYKF